MPKIRVACKRSLISSKEGGTYLILMDVKTKTMAYKAFDITLPEESKEDVEENITCPYCDKKVKIQFKPKKEIFLWRLSKIFCSIVGLGIPIIISFYFLLNEGILFAFKIFVITLVLFSIIAIISYFLSVPLLLLFVYDQILYTDDPDHFAEYFDE